MRGPEGPGGVYLWVSLGNSVSSSSLSKSWPGSSPRHSAQGQSCLLGVARIARAVAPFWTPLQPGMPRLGSAGPRAGLTHGVGVGESLWAACCWGVPWGAVPPPPGNPHPGPETVSVHVVQASSPVHAPQTGPRGQGVGTGVWWPMSSSGTLCPTASWAPCSRSPECPRVISVLWPTGSHCLGLARKVAEISQGGKDAGLSMQSPCPPPAL